MATVPEYIKKSNAAENKIKELEDKLREEKLKFKSLIEIIPAAIFIKDKKNRTIECNDYYARTLNVKKQEILDRPIDGLFPDADLHYRDDLKIIATGHGIYNIVSLLKKNKKNLWLSTNKIPLKNKDGENIGVIGCSLDISLQKQLEKFLIDSKKEKEIILDSISESVLYLDRKYRIVWANKKVLNDTGLNLDELKGKYCYDIWNKYDKPCPKCAAKEAFGSGRDAIMELTDSRKRIFRIRAYPVRGLKNTIDGIVTISLDITQQKQFEEKLRESEERYRFIFNGSHDAIVIADSGSNILDTNHAASILFGYSKDEFKKISLTNLIENFDFHSDENFFYRIMVGEYIICEKEIFRKDRTKVDTEFRGVKIMIKGSPYAYLVIRDIGERKRAQENLNKYYDHLEMLVEQRTTDLKMANSALEQEIEERKKIEEKLRIKKTDLINQSNHLEEVNTALKILLAQRENDKKEVEESVLFNMKELIIPYIEKINKHHLTAKQATLLNIIESNLNNIISPFIKRLSASLLNLTTMQIKVANLVKEGKTNDEIADFLCVSKNTVLSHRYQLRKKLGIKNKKINLRAYLKSLE